MVGLLGSRNSPDWAGREVYPRRPPGKREKGTRDFKTRQTGGSDGSLEIIAILEEMA